jgi:hypothetical protein
VLVTETYATRISDSIAWQPEIYRMPGHGPLEVFTAATSDLNAVTIDLLAAVRAISPNDKALLRTHTAASPAAYERLSETVRLLQDLYTKPSLHAPKVPPGFAPLTDDNTGIIVPQSH